MIVEFPSVKISGIEKKIFSIDLSGGGSSPSTLTISYLTDNIDYTPSNLREYYVTIGSFFVFKGYIVSFSKTESAAGNTTKVTLIDTSIVLDNIFVGLRGKHGPPQAPLTSASSNQRNQTVDLLQLSPTVIQDSSTVKKISNLSIFETKGVFPQENFIFIGDAIDPCKDVNSSSLDECDPCEAVVEGMTQRRLECEKNRSFEILDVDYKFSDLIDAASLKGINFSDTFFAATNYRAQYTGTLREVLNNWCRDFGYTFYWYRNTVYFINLQAGLDIDENYIESRFSNTCTVEEKVLTRSIEGNTKNINIAYFGKAGEIKEYNCDKSESGQEVSTQPITMEPISLELLMDNNNKLLGSAVYKSKTHFRRIISAGNYSKELRDIYCWKELYEYSDPTQVKIGTHSIMGWKIKAVCHNNTTSDQVNGYDPSLCRSLYNGLLTASPDKGAFFTEENVRKLREAGAYFVIAEDMGQKAYDFERVVAKSFCGRYWIHSTNTADAEVIHPDGQVSIIKGLYGNVSYMLPDLNMTHPYIRSSKNKLLQKLRKAKRQEDTLVVVLDRPNNWNPDENAPNIQDFIESVNKCKIEEIEYSDNFAGLEQGDKLFLVYSFGDRPLPNFEVSSESNVINTNENAVDNESDLGIKNRQTYRINFTLRKPNQTSERVEKLQVFMPSEQNYHIKLRPNKSNYSTGPIKAIIPKLEVIVTENNLVSNSNYIGVNVNYQNITDADINKLSRDNYHCYVDKDKVITYAEAIINDLSNDLPLIKKNVDYTILGLPYYEITPSDGLVSFSVKLDSGGTRTSLSFSNIFPENKSDSVKRHEINYLIKHKPVSNYLNNNL